MTLAQGLWRGFVLGSTLLLALPLWMQGGRADPLFLLPLMGWTTMALLPIAGGASRPLTWLARTLGLTALALGIAVWAVSGTFAVMQIAILLMGATPLAWAHRWIAGCGLRWFGLILHGLLVLGWVPLGMAVASASYGWPAPDDRPRVALLSSLPLVWGSATGDLVPALLGEGTPAPLYALLRETAHVQPVDHVTEASLQSTQVLLLVQPRAMPPEALVAIDRWVRRGGRVLWLTDPALHLGAEFSFGDRRNPEFSEPNTALLRRWGVGLQGRFAEQSGLSRRFDNAVPLLLHSPGRLSQMRRNCQLRAEATIAECRIGRGHVLIVADADMVTANLWTREDAGLAHRPLLWTSGNGQWVLAALRQLSDLAESQYLAKPVWLRPIL